MEIIAEVAIAHDGVLDRALLLVRAAAAAGPDAVKFQMVIADELATPDYQHYGTFRMNELPLQAWDRLVRAAHDGAMSFYADIFGSQSLELAQRAGVDGVKIHSSNITNRPLIHEAARRFKCLYLYCGGAEMSEIEAAVASCREAGCAPVLLVGFQAAPTPLEENHLRRIPVLKQRFPDCKVGFMDHTDGLHFLKGKLALVALGLGADCVEKHLTLDHSLQLRDAVSALDPADFKAFCRELKAAELALGSPDLTLSPAERRYAAAYRKRVVAAEDLPARTVLGPQHLTTKRVGGMEERTDLYDRVDLLLGRVLVRALRCNMPVSRNDVRP